MPSGQHTGQNEGSSLIEKPCVMPGLLLMRARRAGTFYSSTAVVHHMGELEAGFSS